MRPSTFWMSYGECQPLATSSPRPSVDDMTGWQVARDYEASAHLQMGAFSLSNLFTPSAKGRRRAFEVSHHLAKAERLERERVVGTLHRAVGVKCFSTNARAEHVGGHKPSRSRCRARKPITASGRARGTARHPEIELLERRGIPAVHCRIRAAG